MPLTSFQRILLAAIAPTRSPTSYLAGGTALHFAPNSSRFSHNVDLFHDAVEQVAEAFAKDSELLIGHGYALEIHISQPGFIRAIVRREGEATQIDWARDSIWRFMPVQKDELGGYVLHRIDLATNKLLALAGREEPRDFIDILFVLDRILPLGALVWAASGKDPGYSPLSLLEQVKRRGRYQPEEFARLDLVKPIDLVETRARWHQALAEAERFIDSRPPEETGCLYYSTKDEQFVEPDPRLALGAQDIVCHFGSPGGVLPKPADQSIQ